MFAKDIVFPLKLNKTMKSILVNKWVNPASEWLTAVDSTGSLAG